MSHPNPSTALGFVVVDELASRGVALVVLAPGSRSSALAIAANEHPDLETRVILDERSAAFHALGVVKASGRPVAVLSTSGTAAANFLPAVVEADLSCSPLVVVTADRPSEQRGLGANQTIDQIELYGAKVRRFAHIEAPDGASDLNNEWRQTVTSAITAATARPPGPVHLNVAFREPTVPVSDDGRSRATPYAFPTNRLDVVEPATPVDRVAIPTLTGARGVVIAGDGEYDRAELLESAHQLGWPVLATAASGMRGMDVIGTYHHLAPPEMTDRLRPEIAVAVGSIGPSPSLERLIGAADQRVRVDLWGRTIDPHRNATHRVTGNVIDLLAVAEPAEPGWLDMWRRVDTSRRALLVEGLRSGTAMSGGLVASLLNELDWDNLVVASSLPIREVDAHLTRPGRVIANRGASGIDGFVSTALGVASFGGSTIAFTGDLSLLHDSNGFIGEVTADVCFVVLDNDGGGLFDGLPQADHAPDYERLFVTPHGRDLSTLARFHDLEYVEATDVDGFMAGVTSALARGGTTIVRVPIDRALDLATRTHI